MEQEMMTNDDRVVSKLVDNLIDKAKDVSVVAGDDVNSDDDDDDDESSSSDSDGDSNHNDNVADSDSDSDDREPEKCFNDYVQTDNTVALDLDQVDRLDGDASDAGIDDVVVDEEDGMNEETTINKCRFWREDRKCNNREEAPQKELKINELKKFFSIGREKVAKLDLETSRYARNKRREREQNLSEEMYDRACGRNGSAESRMTENAFARFGFTL